MVGLFITAVLVVLLILADVKHRHAMRRVNLLIDETCYLRHRDHLVKEAWKTFAIALDVVNDCMYEYYEDIRDEGCGTRAKRRAKITHEWGNAKVAADDARLALIAIGEYDA